MPTTSKTNSNQAVAAKKPSATSPVPEKVPSVLGAETGVESESVKATGELSSDQIPEKEDLPAEPTAWQRLIASPRNTANVILGTIFSIVAIALILYLVIKIRNHHKDLITNGLVLLALIGAIVVINYEYSYRSMVITQSLDYALEIE